MANKSGFDQKKLFIVLIVLLGFAAGYFVARTKYKPQIKTTYDMVMEREDTITDLKAQIEEYVDNAKAEREF